MEKDPFKEILSSNFQEEVPSFDFTQQVMEKVEYSIQNKSVIEPLISKKVWWIIGVFYSVICLYPIAFGMQDSALLFLDQINSIGLDFHNVKQQLQLIFVVLFVFATLTLADIMFKTRKDRLNEMIK